MNTIELQTLLTAAYDPESITDVKRISYGEESLVYSFKTSFNKLYVAKIVSDKLELELLDKLYAYALSVPNDVKFLGTPIRKIGQNVYIFEKYHGDLDKSNLKLQASFGNDLVNAIKTLHSLGYSHGDLKPMNVCLQRLPGKEYGQIRIIDFGFACPLKNQHFRWHLRNTLTFATPYQFFKHIFQSKFTDEPNKYIGEEHKEALETLKELVLWKNKNGEDCIQNDYFACGLLIAYISTKRLNFWSGQRYPKTVVCFKEHLVIMLHSMIDFMRDKERVIDAFIETHKLDKEDQNTKLMKELLLSYDRTK